mmetsp:Transcript_24991/g.46073  ORF Transcript_24991/g.46073 Transcript_24991/m.46073 type:complete len:214 (-) Transcript_24991:1218-1859(-)
MVTVVDMSYMNSITYSDGPTLNTKHGDIDVAIVKNGNDVYVSGGFTHENDWAAPLNKVEKLNVKTQQWINVDGLNEERGKKQLVALNGKVYALGGEDKLNTSRIPTNELPELGGYSVVMDSVEVLDPNEDVHGGLAEWRSLAGMPGRLFRFSAAKWEVGLCLEGRWGMRVIVSASILPIRLWCLMCIMPRRIWERKCRMVMRVWSLVEVELYV